jgi:hypothetical protein
VRVSGEQQRFRASALMIGSCGAAYKYCNRSGRAASRVIDAARRIDTSSLPHYYDRDATAVIVSACRIWRKKGEPYTVCISLFSTLPTTAYAVKIKLFTQQLSDGN